MSTPQEHAIQVRQRGQLTIPQKIRDSLSIKDGDVLTLLQVGNGFFITPKRLYSSELAEMIADMVEESGVSLADLLHDLPEIRAEIYRERYGNKGNAA